MQTLEFPSVFNEVCGQPIQEFGMGWFLPLDPEIIRITGKRFTKMSLPDSVNDGSGG